jgi:hypothetical protein
MKYKTIDRFLAGVLLALVAGRAGAQTQVDLRTQGKAVDFSAAPSTKPFQAGVVLPGTCSQGQAFFKTNAPAGSNYYACTSANTWTLQGGNTGLTYLTQGAEGSLNNSRRLVAGAGIGPLVDSGPGGTLTVAVDTAVVLSQSTGQAGTPWSCISSTASSTTYRCSMSPTQSTYPVNQLLHWVPDVSCGAAPTLNIDNLGPIPVKKISGATLVALTTGDCFATFPYLLMAHGNPVDAFVLR